jgi:hypothetical protein
MMSNVPQDVIDMQQRRYFAEWYAEEWKDGNTTLDDIAWKAWKAAIKNAEHRAMFSVGLKQLSTQRSNAEPVKYMGMTGYLMSKPDCHTRLGFVEEEDKADYEKVGWKFQAVCTATPDAGFAAGMMKAAEIARMTSQETSCRRAADRILSAIPADSKAALREVCMKVVKIVEEHYGYELLVPSALDNIINSVLEGKT